MRGIKASPESANILYNFAAFLENRRKDYSLADDYYQRALEADPTDTDIHAAYADFLEDRIKNKKLAQRHRLIANGSHAAASSAKNTKHREPGILLQLAAPLPRVHVRTRHRILVKSI